jgi:hypothetical protein
MSFIINILFHIIFGSRFKEALKEDKLVGPIDWAFSSPA